MLTGNRFGWPIGVVNIGRFIQSTGRAKVLRPPCMDIGILLTLTAVRLTGGVGYIDVGVNRTLQCRKIL